MRTMNGLEMLPFAVGQGADLADRRYQHPMSNIQYPTTNETDRRRGVALIIVLGFLTIMVLMAVAFLTQARIERMVADSTLEAMRGRQLLRTALNAGMNDYSIYLWNRQLYVPSDIYDRVFNSAPPKGSTGPFAMPANQNTIGETKVELLVGEASDWIPREYLYDTDGNPNADVMQIVSNAEWILVREDPEDGDSRILGRYAYACFDMSGGIDANLIAREEGVAQIGNKTNRPSVRQIGLGDGGILPETADASIFKSLRKGWKGFDSLQALVHLTDGDANDGANPPTANRWQPERKEINGAGLSSNKVSALVPYSLSAYRGGRYNRGTAEWDELVALDDVSGIVKLLEKTYQQDVDQPRRFADNWQNWITEALFDYMADTDVPSGTDYPSPKNVPMFNEIDMRLRLHEEPPAAGATNSTYALSVEMNLEFWYPFPSKDNAGAGIFRLESPSVRGYPAYSPGTDEQIFMQIWLVDPSTGRRTPVTFDAPAGASPPVSVMAQWNGGVPYNAETLIVSNALVHPAAGGLLPPGAGLHVETIEWNQPFYLYSAGGGKADMIPGRNNPDSTGPSRPLGFVRLDVPPNGSVMRTLEVRDPRLNHLRGTWAQEDAPSPNAMNRWYANPAASSAPGQDTRTQALLEGLNLYCRNGPMKSPAELGFISTGNPDGWRTIDLCTDAGAELMANLALPEIKSQLLTNVNHVVYTNGTINPNTRNPSVMIAAFTDLMANEVPNQNEADIGYPNPIPPVQITKTVSSSIASNLAADIVTETDSEGRARPFQAGSDWARVPAMEQPLTPAQSELTLNNNQRESLIRNTWGLFSPDSGMFTIVAIAQAIKEGPDNVGKWSDLDDMVTGERRAVALAWRDPFKSRAGEQANLHHEMFMRMIRYLND